MKEREKLEEKKRRSASLYEDLAINDEEYHKERLSIDAALAGLIIPEEHEAIEAGSFLTDLGKLWQEATLEAYESTNCIPALSG